jgi:16S rRNA (cytidine1402-2'-O)-methyltransferase
MNNTGILYILATPIGNLADLSLRAIQTLRDADGILAEDTRVAQRILQHLSLRKPTISVHAHNEQQRWPKILSLLQKSENWVYLSDAGTPSISDPGSALVCMAHAHDIRVVPIPGPSALTCALSATGLLSDQNAVLFLGFLPLKGTKRKIAWQRIQTHPGVTVLFESTQRLNKTIDELHQLMPTRMLGFCRELTKYFEEIWVKPIPEALAKLTQNTAALRGECTLVIGSPPPVTQQPEEDLLEKGALSLSLEHAILRCRQKQWTKRDTIEILTTLFDCSKALIYKKVHEELS